MDVEFLGHHSPRLDEKGRLFLPAKFRDDLGDKIVVTKGFERCLTIYPHPVFKQRILDPLNAANTSSKTVRSVRRQLLGDASTENPDRQGRVTIPGVLRSYAGLDKDCVVIGQGHYLEVWDSATYEAANATDGTTLEDLHDEGVVLL
ncbi:division/cell wall cluster transcriptional repressor MraZ [Nostocoides australiense]|nr:division/cell wall cluster transcriptional repressor MraZ [Actinomycetota bacterium]MCB1300534.1 division/cell wall cluster transcriptional repressor MraZ [Tetrasphaera sp.]HPF79600.1 division/cell wall cluster transcriptional repressor MraZ [Tetrasphaera australiensis]HRW00713.1 division/cell wall cluster transcriptional repressor MraZ [Tetrasphaera sp.]